MLESVICEMILKPPVTVVGRSVNDEIGGGVCLMRSVVEAEIDPREAVIVTPWSVLVVLVGALTMILCSPVCGGTATIGGTCKSSG